MIKSVCITGCLGFMGSHFTRACLKKGWRVLGIDLKTYTANEASLKEFLRHRAFEFHHGDIVALNHMKDVDYVFNFAAETHVDNSIIDSSRFLHTNILGVQNLLELIRAMPQDEMPVFVQISTDEVYGDIKKGAHKITDSLRPSNPYSATKAAADMLIMAWQRTHGVPFMIVRPTNNYGTGQYPEKLIPKAVRCLALGKMIPLHGDGTYVRNWLHVDDMIAGLFTLIERGTQNQVYNMAGNFEVSNREVIALVLRHYFGRPVKLENHVKFRCVRQGVDARYSVDDSSLRALGWKNLRRFKAEIRGIVRLFAKARSPKIAK